MCIIEIPCVHLCSLQPDLVILCLLLFETLVLLYEQRYLYQDSRKIPDGIIFPNTKRADADNGLEDCFKYLVNYGFYKFGLEASFWCLESLFRNIYELVAYFN